MGCHCRVLCFLKCLIEFRSIFIVRWKIKALISWECLNVFLGATKFANSIFFCKYVVKNMLSSIALFIIHALSLRSIFLDIIPLLLSGFLFIVKVS